MSFWRAFGESPAHYLHAGGPTLAASIAFFGLLSILPMVFLLIHIIGFFVSHDRIGHEYLVTFLQGFLPNMWPQLAAEMERIAREQAARWIGLLSFLWFACLVFYEIEYALHCVFGTKHRRNPLTATIRSIALLGLFGALVVVSFTATQVMNLLISQAPRIGGLDAYVSLASQFLLSYLLPFLLLLLAVTCLYRYVPPTRPSWRDAFAGATFLALLWELAKHLFSSYLQNLSVYGRMYGSLLAVVLFLLWMYYSASLFLFGAALVHRLQRIRETFHARSTPALVPSGLARNTLSLPPRKPSRPLKYRPPA